MIFEFGAQEELQLLALLVSAAALLILAGPLRIPYPILLVLGGLLLGFAPGVPAVTMPPEVVLIGILPPLLYVAAYFTGLRELRQNLRPDLAARGRARRDDDGRRGGRRARDHRPAVGGVVRARRRRLADGSDRGHRDRAAARGAAAADRHHRGREPRERRHRARAAAHGDRRRRHRERSRRGRPGWRLVLNIVGGIAVGLAVGYVVRRVRRVLDNPPLEVTIAFLTGYFAFLPAAALGVSGVLAVVTAGIYVGWYTPELTTVQTRLQGRGFWEILTFLLNALLFGLVGLQLRPILDALSGTSGWSLVGDAVVIVLAVIVVRIVWVFPATYVPRWLSPSLRERDPAPPWRYPAFVSWNGMRGAVTIAAALLIPLHTDAGAPFPGRDLIIFFAFAVVLATLVVQGLSLPAVIRVLGLEGRRRRRRPRRRSRAFAPPRPRSTRLDELAGEGWVLDDTAERLRGQYRFRIDRFSARVDPDGDGKIEKRSLKYQRLRRELIDAERHAVVELRNTGEISDEVMRRVERDLDLEVSRLDN